MTNKSTAAQLVWAALYKYNMEVKPALDDWKALQAAMDELDALQGQLAAARDLIDRMVASAGGRQAEELSEEDFRRVKACVAFCEGISDDKLEQGIAEYVAAESYLSAFNVSNGSASLQLNGLACQMLACAFAGQFKANGAENFLCIDMEHRLLGAFTVTIQRLNKKTPAERINEVTAQRNDLLKAADRFASNWLVDERDDRETCMNDQHYEDVQNLFKAIERAKEGAA